MRIWLPRGIGLSPLLLVLLFPAMTVSAGEEPPPAGSFQLLPPEGVAATTLGEIPANGTIWREFYDRGGGWSGRRDRTQTDYVDNGDLVISAGDVVSLDGVPYPVAGTRLNVCGSTRISSYCQDDIAMWWFVGDVLSVDDPGEGIIRLQLQELWLYWEQLSAWAQDNNGNHGIDIGDRIYWNIGICLCSLVVTESYTAVTLSEFGAVPVEPSTWGRLKTLF